MNVTLFEDKNFCDSNTKIFITRMEYVIEIKR